MTEPMPPTGFDAAIVERLLALALAKTPPRGGARILAISGAQGSGKSTLAAQIVEAARARGLSALSTSLDDFYLDLPQRERLAARVHPLLATRGAPGTHDVGLLRSVLAKLRSGEPVLLPRFDKGSDRRLPAWCWQRAESALDLCVLEGWCLGVEAQGDAALARPANALEADEDPLGIWRRHVDAALARDYAPLWAEFDLLAMLRAPSFEVVAAWRDQAEAALRAAGAQRAMSTERIRRFVMLCQRLTEHALATLPSRADVVIALDAARAPATIAEAIAPRNTPARIAARTAPIDRGAAA